MLNNKSKLQIINTDKGIAEWLHIMDFAVSSNYPGNSMKISVNGEIDVNDESTMRKFMDLLMY